MLVGPLVAISQIARFWSGEKARQDSQAPGIESPRSLDSTTESAAESTIKPTVGLIKGGCWVARTVNVAEHAARRDAILDAAQRLILSNGYERLTVQDLLDDLEISKGAFYHYFDSKPAVIEALSERLVEDSERALAPIVADQQAGCSGQTAAVLRRNRSLEIGAPELVCGDAAALVCARQHYLPGAGGSGNGETAGAAADGDCAPGGR